MRKTVNLTTINRASTVIKNEVENLKQQLTKIDNAKEKLQSAWKDTTASRNAEKYITALEEAETKLAKEIDLYNELVAILERNAKRYAEMKISGIGGAK